MQSLPAQFEDHAIRRVYDEDTEIWWFSVIDIVQILTQQPDYQAARNYWKVLKNRLAKEGSQSVTKCNRLKLPAADGKSYLTDVATARNPAAAGAVGAQPQGRADQTLVGQGGLRTHAGNGRPGPRRSNAPAKPGSSTDAARSGSSSA